MACLVAVLRPTPITSIENPEEFPNLLAGSFTDGQSFSTGNTLPLIARPWGFNHWSIQTNRGATAWWFRGDAHEFHWLRLTHQPSPWIGDWAWLQFGPQMGGLVADPVMFWEPWGARVKPHVLDARLGPDNMRVQLTPTDHGAVLKVTFPAYNPRRNEKRVCFKLPQGGKSLLSNPARLDNFDERELWLELTTSRADDVPRNFALRVRAEVDVASLRFREGASIHRGSNINCFAFSIDEVDVTIWLASSLVSAEQARMNLAREVRGRGFDEVLRESTHVWRGMLQRVDVVDPGPLGEPTVRRLVAFYTGLYRALIFPRRLDEVTADGKRVAYNPYDAAGGVHDGILVADNGFWDTWRTVYPLYALAFPEEAGEIVTGWLNAFRWGGWLPEWSSPGYRQCMVGTYADVVVADAVLKGLPGVDHDLAWKAIWKDSTVAGGGSRQGGKAHFPEYSSRNFITAERTADSVSGTLDYAYSDFAVALAGDKLGYSREAKALRARAFAARQALFESRSGLMRPKTGHGGLKSDDPTQWGSGYVEGSAWHHSFPAFDLPGLVALHGSSQELAKKIKQMWEEPGTFRPGSYGRAIHEMEEMRALGTGQYGHNNQPSHHVLFLLPLLDEGRPECSAAASKIPDGALCPRRLGETYVHTVMSQAYGFDFYAGDEDNGEMGAWYVLAALGLFEAAPGTDAGYTLGSPVFRRVDLYRTGKGKAAGVEPSLSIRSSQAGVLEALHVSSVQLEEEQVGQPAAGGKLGWTLSYDRIAAAKTGGVLRFLTGNETAATAVLAEAAAGAAAAGAGGGSGGAQPEAEELRRQVGDLQQEIKNLEKQAAEQRVRAAAAPQSSPSSSSAAAAAAAAPPPPPPAPAPGAAAEGAAQAALLRQVESLQRQLEEARQKAAAQRSPSLEGDHAADRQKISQLQSLLEHQRQLSRHDTETDAGLAFMVKSAFMILLVVNILLWIVCSKFRLGASAQSNGGAGSSGKKVRTKSNRVRSTEDV